MVTNFELSYLCRRWASLITDNTTYNILTTLCIVTRCVSPVGAGDRLVAGRVQGSARVSVVHCTVLCNATQVATVLHCTHQPAPGPRVKPGFGSCRVMHWCHARHDSRHRVTLV